MEDNKQQALGRGNAYFKEKEYAFAIEHYDEVIYQEPEDYKSQAVVLALYKKGVCFYNLGMYKESLTCYNTIIKHNPQYAPAYAMKAKLMLKDQEIFRAVVAFDKAIVHEKDTTLITHAKIIRRDLLNFLSTEELSTYYNQYYEKLSREHKFLLQN